MVDKLFVPKLPFPDFKWKWASVAPTEGINDPAVLLGVLSRIAKLSGKGLKYSSEEFHNELIDLAGNLEGTGIHVDIAGRGGERNLMRNSGQYWRSLNLIPNVRGGEIQLTTFGRKVADNTISQSEFSATILMTYTLPNPNIQSSRECKQWKARGIKIQPLRLLLEISRGLFEKDGDESQAYLTKDEVINIIEPLSSYSQFEKGDYVEYIQLYRRGELDITKWPKVCTRANDHRIAREFMLFLSYYGYFKIQKADRKEMFCYNFDIDDEICEILSKNIYKDEQCLEFLRSSGVIFETERKLIESNVKKYGRGGLQPKFRRELLNLNPKCIISGIDMPEVLIAAHIKPVEYNGGYDSSNGFLMRTDLHLLFDANHLKINPVDDKIAEIEVDQITRNAYGFTIPPNIILPDYIDKNNLKWRYDNYRGIKMASSNVVEDIKQ